MIFWAIECAEEVPGIFLPDGELADATHREGANPIVVRDALDAVKAKPVCFELIEADGVTLAHTKQPTFDLMIWSWVPVFSDSARELLVGLGCGDDDFWPCTFASNPGDEFFLHLPLTAVDAVDVDRSDFAATIPVIPPIPHHILKLVLKDGIPLPPACFRAPMPGYSQFLGDLFVSDELKSQWEMAGLSGAIFRKIM